MTAVAREIIADGRLQPFQWSAFQSARHFRMTDEPRVGGTNLHIAAHKSSTGSSSTDSDSLQMSNKVGWVQRLLQNLELVALHSWVEQQVGRFRIT